MLEKVGDIAWKVSRDHGGVEIDHREFYFIFAGRAAGPNLYVRGSSCIREFRFRRRPLHDNRLLTLSWPLQTYEGSGLNKRPKALAPDTSMEHKRKAYDEEEAETKAVVAEVIIVCYPTAARLDSPRHELLAVIPRLESSFSTNSMS